jgi:hypothetical protein
MGFNWAFKGLNTILNNFQQHVSTLRRHLQAKYKKVYIIQRLKMDGTSFTLSLRLLKGDALPKNRNVGSLLSAEMERTLKAVVVA